MKNRLLIVLLPILFFIGFSCGEKEEENIYDGIGDKDNENSDEGLADEANNGNQDNDTLDNDSANVDDPGEIGDIGDTGNDGDTGDSGDTETPCTLDTTWMTPKSEWVSWGYLKMMGPIADKEGTEYVPAVFTDGKIKLTDTTTELTDGSFMNFQGSTLLAEAVNFEFINQNQTALTATIDYWEAMYQFSQALIPAMKEQAVREAGFGATVFFRHSFIDVKFTQSGQITSSFTRKNCFLGLSKTEEQTYGTDTYNVPIGDMYGCFDANVDGSVGEDLKMMFKNEFTEDEATMLAFFNPNLEGEVLQYGDEGYTHLCTCYKADGTTEVNCWNEYDGPGGVEECPAVVEAAGECDAVTPDDDVNL